MLGDLKDAGVELARKYSSVGDQGGAVKLDRKVVISRICIGVVAVLGISLLAYHTRFGLGTTGDSVHYLMGAQNLLEGNGYSRWSGGGEIRPITMFPPFYSDVIAAIGLLNIAPFVGARILNILLFGANIFLCGLLVYRYTRSTWAAMIGAAIFLGAPEIFLYHGWLLTESLFIFLMLATCLSFVHYLDSNKSLFLVLTGVWIGMATLTRYVGLSLLISSLMAILLLSRHPWKRRLVDCVVLSAVGLLPLFIWLIRNALVGETLVNRQLSFHPIPVDLIRAYRAEISFWFVPQHLGFRHSLRKALMLLLGIPAPAIFFLIEFRHRFLKKPPERRPSWSLPWILAFFLISYTVILFLNLTFLDALIDFNTVPRYLMPILTAGIILFVLVFYRLAELLGGMIPVMVASALALTFIVLYAQQTFEILKDPLAFIGYTGFKQQRIETVEMLEKIDSDVPIISNDPETVYIFSGRPAYMLPVRYDANTGKEREDFIEQVEATEQKLKLGGVLVLFSPIKDAEFEVVELLHADLIDVFHGSMFYAYSESINE